MFTVTPGEWLQVVVGAEGVTNDCGGGSASGGGGGGSFVFRTLLDALPMLAAGGGGSYNGGTNQINTAGAVTGNGSITIAR